MKPLWRLEGLIEPLRAIRVLDEVATSRAPAPRARFEAMADDLESQVLEVLPDFCGVLGRLTGA